MQLAISNSDLTELHQRLFAYAPAEGAAFLAVEPSQRRLLVRSFHVFERCELEDRGLGDATITEDAQIRELAALKRAGHTLAEVHTHPGSGRTVRFSSLDNDELPAFARYVQNKLRRRPFAALVLSEEGYAGRGWAADGRPMSLELTPVGEASTTPNWLAPGDVCSQRTVEERFDRQIRALGPEGQSRIRSLRVGVVGLGGTGSQVVQQLAHLGVSDFVLVEDDRVDWTNLPRLVGATFWDARLRRRKTGVARRMIRRLAKRSTILTPGSLRTCASLTALADIDLIIGCVDNDGARLVLSELAAAHLVPYLDIGVGIEGEPGAQQIGGRVSFYIPGGPCLACADELDFDEAAADLQSEAIRRIRIERGYAKERAIEPALMPLNTVLVGAAMMEFLAYVTGIRPVVSFSRYDGFAGRFILQRVEMDDDCPVCRPAYGMGERHEIDRYALD